MSLNSMSSSTAVKAISAVKAIKWLDKYIGSVLGFVLGFFTASREHLRKEYSSILCIQLWGIGESILTLPAIKAIRDKHPKAKIAVLATRRNRAVYEHVAFVDEIEQLSFNPLAILAFCLSRTRKYDLVVDFEEYLNISAIISFFVGKAKAGFSHGIRATVYNTTAKYDDTIHTAQVFMNLASLVAGEKKLISLVRLRTTKAEQDAVKRFLHRYHQRYHQKKLIGVTAGAAESARSRMWPQERYSRVIDAILHRYRNAVVLLIGSPDEKQYLEGIRRQTANRDRLVNCSGLFTLREIFFLIEKCSLYISNDTGPMHMAAAQGVPTIALFGPNTPARWAPFGRNRLGKQNISLYEKQFCSPCIHTHLGIVPECIFGPDNKCMRAITVEMVLSAAERLIR